ELRYMKTLYGAEFREAFAQAMATLKPREQNLLRQHHVDGLTIDQLGQLYHVHRATAARWLGKARSSLLAQTRRSFMKRIRLSHSQFDSVLGLVQSQLVISFRRLFTSRA